MIRLSDHSGGIDTPTINSGRMVNGYPRPSTATPSSTPSSDSPRATPGCPPTIIRPRRPDQLQTVKAGRHLTSRTVGAVVTKGRDSHQNPSGHVDVDNEGLESCVALVTRLI